MTASRIVRGTKARVFLYICAILFITGIIACYNNVRVKLDDMQKAYDLCKQETENLSSQIQVIYEYKTRIEKSLKTEKAEHQRTKSEFESRFNDEKLRNDKVGGESKLRFSTLQQHYNLLQTQHDDFKDECSKIQRKQLDEVNKLQSKLSEVQEQLKAVENDKQNAIELLKTQNQLLKEEKLKLQQKLTEQKENDLKHEEEIKQTELSSTHFSQQLALGDSKYVMAEKEQEKSVGDIPANANEVLDQQMMDANQGNMDKNVLALPNNLAPIRAKSSTPNSLSKKGISKPDINAAFPLNMPTVTPETLKKSTSKEMKKSKEDVLPLPHANKKLPAGVVPVQHVDDFNHDKTDSEKNIKGGAIINNRYRDQIIEAQPKDDSKMNSILIKDNDRHNDHFNEIDNVAHEIFDEKIEDKNAYAKADVFKKHIDELALAEENNKDVLDYDAHDEQEDDDDGNPLIGDRDPAVRN